MFEGTLIPLSYAIDFSEKMDGLVRVSYTFFDFELKKPTRWVVHSGSYCMNKNTGEFVKNGAPLVGAYFPEHSFDSAEDAAGVYFSFHAKD